jgi:hypothetical protein
MSLATTVLDEYRLGLERSKLDFAENRMANYGALETAKRDTPNLVPGYQELINERVDADRTASIVVMQRFNPTTAAARSCNASTADSTSAYVTPSWTTIETGFFMNKARNLGNYVSYQQDLNHKMGGVERVFLEATDTAVVTHLEANKTTTNSADDNPFNFTANSMVVPLADHDTFFNEVDQIYMQNDYPSGATKNVVASPRLSSIIRYYANQGAANSANYAFQYADFNFGYTNNITVSATSDIGILYVMPVGTLAYLSWIDPDCRLGQSAGDKEWFTQMLPKLGHEVGVYYQKACYDYSGTITGLERTLSEHYEFSFDYTVLSSYISTGAKPIFKANFQSV